MVAFSFYHPEAGECGRRVLSLEALALPEHRGDVKAALEKSGRTRMFADFPMEWLVPVGVLVRVACFTVNEGFAMAEMLEGDTAILNMDMFLDTPSDKFINQPFVGGEKEMSDEFRFEHSDELASYGCCYLAALPGGNSQESRTVVNELGFFPRAVTLGEKLVELGLEGTVSACDEVAAGLLHVGGTVGGRVTTEQLLGMSPTVLVGAGGSGSGRMTPVSSSNDVYAGGRNGRMGSSSGGEEMYKVRVASSEEDDDDGVGVLTKEFCDSLVIKDPKRNLPYASSAEGLKVGADLTREGEPVEKQWDVGWCGALRLFPSGRFCNACEAQVVGMPIVREEVSYVCGCAVDESKTDLRTGDAFQRARARHKAGTGQVLLVRSSAGWFDPGVYGYVRNVVAATWTQALGHTCGCTMGGTYRFNLRGFDGMTVVFPVGTVLYFSSGEPEKNVMKKKKEDWVVRFDESDGMVGFLGSVSFECDLPETVTSLLVRGHTATSWRRWLHKLPVTDPRDSFSRFGSYLGSDVSLHSVRYQEETSDQAASGGLACSRAETKRRLAENGVADGLYDGFTMIRYALNGRASRWVETWSSGTAVQCVTGVVRVAGVTVPCGAVLTIARSTKLKVELPGAAAGLVEVYGLADEYVIDDGGPSDDEGFMPEY